MCLYLWDLFSVLDSSEGGLATAQKTEGRTLRTQLRNENAREDSRRMITLTLLFQGGEVPCQQRSTGLQGYLAHKKQHPPLGPPCSHGHSPTVGAYWGAVCYPGGPAVPRNFRALSARNPVTLPTGNFLCPYGIACRNGYESSTPEYVFKKSLCSPLCGCIPGSQPQKDMLHA